MATTTLTPAKVMAALEAEEVLVETNAGTYGAAEACRKIGVGDPRFGDYRVYERVADGRRRVEGCDPAAAPGYARHFRREIEAKRTRLAELRAKLKAIQAR